MKLMHKSHPNSIYFMDHFVMLHVTHFRYHWQWKKVARKRHVWRSKQLVWNELALEFQFIDWKKNTLYDGRYTIYFFIKIWMLTHVHNMSCHPLIFLYFLFFCIHNVTATHQYIGMLQKQFLGLNNEG